MAAVVYQYDKTLKAAYLTFSAWISAIGAEPRSIIIATDTEVTGSVTLPENIDLAGFYNGAKFTGTGSLTINKMTCSPRHKIFDDNLTVSLKISGFGTFEWFGSGATAKSRFLSSVLGSQVHFYDTEDGNQFKIVDSNGTIYRHQLIEEV